MTRVNNFIKWLPDKLTKRYDTQAIESPTIPLLTELEKQGVIKARTTELDAEALGFSLTVFALVSTNQHSDEWFSRFEKAVNSIPEILDFYRTSGSIDYLLKVVARDVRHYDQIYKRLIREVDFADISSTFVMETFKSGNQLPI